MTAVTFRPRQWRPVMYAEEATATRRRGLKDEASEVITMAVNPNIAVAQSYFDALARKDLRALPLASDVTLESPVTPRLCGAEAVLEYLEALTSVAKAVRTFDFIAEGGKVAVQFELETADAVIPGFDCLEISDGLIRKLRPYFESRPLTNGPAQNKA